jgi:acyl-CoA synthetase (AMP-forming)/AMP-acid ligase II
MPQPNRRLGLLDLALASGGSGRRTISDPLHRVELTDLERSTNVLVPLETLRGRSVLLLTEPQLPTVLAVLALDGIARRLILGLPDLGETHLPQVIVDGSVDFVLRDDALSSTVRCDRSAPHVRDVDTEWILFTSGTTGAPKMVSHTLASLTGPLDDGVAAKARPVWSTFYDIRRYGGLQILLRALLGGGSMVLSSAAESVGDFLTRAGKSGTTHISGTPSHWRRALMSEAANRIAPKYVRLSGEISDQAILDKLKAFFPRSEVAHAFASTEAGVGFDVRDGLAGFPADYIGAAGAKAELKVEDGTLRIRSARTASCYLGATARLGDSAGFIDTGDMVERRGDRYHFLGRREGVVNVGGQKVYPEEVEAVLNCHPAVQISRVWARKSPITGAVVAADVVLREPRADFARVKASLLESCRAALSAYKVPVTLRAVASLGFASSGKLSRHNG